VAVSVAVVVLAFATLAVVSLVAVVLGVTEPVAVSVEAMDIDVE